MIVSLVISLGLQAGVNPKFLTISDIHYGSKNTSADGHDTGDDLFATFLKQMSELSSDVDFILVLGDLPTHMLGVAPEKEVYERAVFKGLYQADTKAKPMFYIPGNNDSLAGNYQPFEVNGKSPLNMASDWHGACVYCDGLIIDAKHMYDGGYYSSYVMPNNKDVVLIVLNSTQWIKPRIFAPKYPNQKHDAAEQLKWFGKQLKNHHAKQLLIAMHAPPGFDYKGNQFWYKKYQKKFIDLIKENKYLYAQVTLLTSHTHMDEFRKITLSDKHNIYAFSTPSVSRDHHNNSAMKLYKLNDDLKISGFTTYFTTNNLVWGGEHYDALHSTNAILPECKQATIAKCLDELTTEKLCQALDEGKFYGVKSEHVELGLCKHIYAVN